MKTLLALLCVGCCFSLTYIAESNEKTDTVFLSFPGFEEKAGVAFKPKEVEMVALYRGNNLYLRPFSKKMRVLLGTQKAVATKTLSLPKMVAEEVGHGRRIPASLLISKRSFANPDDAFFFLTSRGKNISGKFTSPRGDREQAGIILFLGKKGVHIYRFSIREEGVAASFHTLSEKQYKTAKNRVERKLKAAGQKSAAQKVGEL